MTTVYLIRHGEVADATFFYGRTDMPLSSKGVDQLTRNGLYLKEQGVIPHAILASPLRRTQQSAEAVGRPFGVPITSDDNLIEVDMGDVQGLPLSFYQEVDGDLYTHPYQDKPRVNETREQVAARMLHTINRITSDHPDGTIFVVSHGDPLALTFWKLLHPDEPIPAVREIENRRLYIPKGAMIRVGLDENRRVSEYEFIRLPDQEMMEGQIRGKERE